MHIVFATVEFVTEGMGDGGLANYLMKASRIFAAHGHRITIVVSSGSNEAFEYKPNIRVVRVLREDSEIAWLLSRVKDMELKKNLASCWHSYKVNRKIREINSFEKIDMVQYCHLDALGLFRIKEIPSVVRMSAFEPICREAFKSDFILGQQPVKIELMDKINFLALHRADGVFAPGALTAHIIQKMINREVKVLESPTMGVDFDSLDELPEKLSGKKYFLYFGTLNNIKGLKVLVQSIYEILQNNPAYYFVFVGKDCGVSMREGMRTSVVRKLKEEAKEFRDRIIYFPAMNDKELLNVIIYHAQLCILPFRFENLPNTCIEAMELGKIVISTQQSGVSQLIKDGYNGFLVEQNNPRAIVEKVQEVLALPDEKKKQIVNRAVRRIQRMNPDNFYRYMMGYYQEMIQKKKRL